MFLFFILIIRSTENFAQKKLWFFKYIVNSDIDLVTREWIFGYLELSRKIGFLKEASLEQKFSSYLAPNFLMIFHIILIIPKNENKSLVQLAIKTIYSTCHFKNLFFSGMPNLSLIINAFFLSISRLHSFFGWWVRRGCIVIIVIGGTRFRNLFKLLSGGLKIEKKIVHQNKKFGEIDSYHELFA